MTLARFAVLAAGLACAALVAAGCGGDDEQGSAVEWADGLCSAITTWRDDLQAIGDRFGDPSSVSRDMLEEAAGDARDATEELVDELRGLGGPDTESGDEAEQALEELSTELESRMDRIEEEVETAAGIPGTIASVTNILAELAAMSAAVQSAYSTITNLEPGGELRDAFEQADSCDDLR